MVTKRQRAQSVSWSKRQVQQHRVQHQPRAYALHLPLARLARGPPHQRPIDRGEAQSMKGTMSNLPSKLDVGCRKDTRGSMRQQ